MQDPKDVQSKLHNCYNGIVRIFTSGQPTVTSLHFVSLWSFVLDLQCFGDQTKIFSKQTNKDDNGQQVLENLIR